MSGPGAHVDGVGTGAEDYSLTYYASHLGEQDYGWETTSWREFFLGVAARLTSLLEPRTVLDVGCARGLLVQALRQHDVAAKGFDISDHAVSAAHDDVRDHLWVQSATEPIEGRYDLVTCVEVLEHMSPDEADQAMDRICAVTDLVLFSSSPGDFAESTHINVRPTADWVAAFAQRGFFRRTDVNVDFLTGWAVLLAREPLTGRDVVARYESQYAALHDEVLGKRSALLEAHREIGRLHARVNDPDAEVRLERERAVAATLSTQARGELNHARRELAARQKNAETADKLVASLQERLEASNDRVTELVAQLRTSRSQEKSSNRALRKARKRLRRTRRALRRQRGRATRAEVQLVTLRTSRAYRLADRLRSPGRAWDRTKRALRPAQRDGGASR